MSGDPSATMRTAVDLATLSNMLKSEVLPAQEVIAKRVGVSQSLVSRARSGKLHRVTEKLQSLWNYANETLAQTDVGGPRDAERWSRQVAPISPDEGAAAFEAAARRELDQYLRDGYDPRLVAEQLVVLRKAQRRRVPGRRPIS